MLCVQVRAKKLSEYQREGLRATAEPSHNPVAARANVVTAALRPEGPPTVSAGSDGRGILKAKDMAVYKGSCDEKTIARMMDRLAEGLSDGGFIYLPCLPAPSHTHTAHRTLSTSHPALTSPPPLPPPLTPTSHLPPPPFPSALLLLRHWVHIRCRGQWPGVRGWHGA
jgi:hypothetical protein